MRRANKRMKNPCPVGPPGVGDGCSPNPRLPECPKELTWANTNTENTKKNNKNAKTEQTCIPNARGALGTTLRVNAFCENWDLSSAIREPHLGAKSCSGSALVDRGSLKIRFFNYSISFIFLLFCWKTGFGDLRVHKFVWAETRHALSNLAQLWILKVSRQMNE